MFSPPTCPRCGIPFSSKETLSKSPQHICGECRVSPPPFGPYEGTMAEAIHKFKYSKKRSLGSILGGLLYEYLSSSPFSSLFTFHSSLLLVPVPLHPERLREREFNQSTLLAKELSKGLSIPMMIDNLFRIRNTRAQIGLEVDERKRNMKGAFSLKKPLSVEGKTVLLIDDVYTTGSTIKECTRVLKKAGAESVYAVTLARTI